MAAEITIKTASECLDQLYTFLKSCGKEAKFKVDDVGVFHNEGHVYLMFAGHAQQDMRLQRRVVDGVEHVFVQYPSVKPFRERKARRARDLNIVLHHRDFHPGRDRCRPETSACRLSRTWHRVPRGSVFRTSKPCSSANLKTLEFVLAMPFSSNRLLGCTWFSIPIRIQR